MSSDRSVSSSNESLGTLVALASETNNRHGRSVANCRKCLIMKVDYPTKVGKGTLENPAQLKKFRAADLPVQLHWFCMDWYSRKCYCMKYSWMDMSHG